MELFAHYIELECEMEKIISFVNENNSKLLEIRKTLHQNPELSNEEEKTTEIIKKFLEENGIDFFRFKNINGGYVFIDCKKEESIAYRADIDALPVYENTSCEFISKNEGLMHACGHDVHTTIALGLCLCLNKFKNLLNNNFVIIFQPAEENNPRGGAKDVIKEGIFEKFSIKEIYGAHCWPKYPVGDVLVKKGVQQAASNKFTVSINGLNSHAAQPHLGIDAINISIQFVDFAINKLRREISPNDICVISIGKIESKGRYNVISDRVILEGTIRSSNIKTQKYIFKRLEEYISFTNFLYYTNSEIKIANGYGCVENDDDMVNKFTEFYEKHEGVNIISDFETSLIAEDFYAYGEITKSMFAFLGCGTDEPLHSSSFLPKSEIIGFGIKLFANFFLI